MNSSLNGSLQVIRQHIQNVLEQNRPGMVYGRQLQQVSSQWLEPDFEQISINALPFLVCEATGGDSSQAIPVAAAWQLVRLAAKLLDDVEDQETTNRVGEIINMAIGFLQLSQLLLWELLDQGISNEQVQRMCQSLNQAILQACSGQHLDLSSTVNRTRMDPDTWLEVAAAKSGALLAWAAWAGAVVTDRDEHALTCYHDYGHHLGILLQVADDFNGVWASSGISDLRNNNYTLPVCYALSVTKGKTRKYLERLLEKALDGDAVAEAQTRQTMIDAGAQAYLLVVGRLHYQQALSAIQRVRSGNPNNESLVSLLDNVWPLVTRSAV